jgi:protein-tyrosine phosphatase
VKTILFLCSGNYYRSRFAESLFNSLAAQMNLGWVADSRGLIVEGNSTNPGPMSIQALEGLAARNIEVPKPVRFPLQLQEADLERAGLIVAVKETEHRPMIARQFPAWDNKITYWHIHDLDKSTADEALPELERLVRRLVQQLSTGTVD